MKYLAGAITYNDENKIEFTLDTDANGKTAKQIYDIVLKYMSELTQNEQNIASRVALVNDAEHVIANTMDEWLVFSQSFISLDRTEFKYLAGSQNFRQSSESLARSHHLQLRGRKKHRFQGTCRRGNQRQDCAQQEAERPG
ncbi:MAG: DUF4468 domain-containing protein [Segatella copri]